MKKAKSLKDELAEASILEEARDTVDAAAQRTREALNEPRAFGPAVVGILIAAVVASAGIILLRRRAA